MWLVPVRGSTWDDLIASGRIIPRTDDTDITEEEPADYGVDASRILQAMRDPERF